MTSPFTPELGESESEVELLEKKEKKYYLSSSCKTSLRRSIGESLQLYSLNLNLCDVEQYKKIVQKINEYDTNSNINLLAEILVEKEKLYASPLLSSEQMKMIEKVPVDILIKAWFGFSKELLSEAYIYERIINNILSQGQSINFVPMITYLVCENYLKNLKKILEEDSFKQLLETFKRKYSILQPEININFDKIIDQPFNILAIRSFPGSVSLFDFIVTQIDKYSNVTLLWIYTQLLISIEVMKSYFLSHEALDQNSNIMIISLPQEETYAFGIDENERYWFIFTSRYIPMIANWTSAISLNVQESYPVVFNAENFRDNLSHKDINTITHLFRKVYEFPEWWERERSPKSILEDSNFDIFRVNNQKNKTLMSLVPYENIFALTPIIKAKMFEAKREYKNEFSIELKFTPIQEEIKKGSSEFERFYHFSFPSPFEFLTEIPKTFKEDVTSVDWRKKEISGVEFTELYNYKSIFEHWGYEQTLRDYELKVYNTYLQLFTDVLMRNLYYLYNYNYNYGGNPKDKRISLSPSDTIGKFQSQINIQEQDLLQVRKEANIIREFLLKENEMFKEIQNLARESTKNKSEGYAVIVFAARQFLLLAADKIYEAKQIASWILKYGYEQNIQEAKIPKTLPRQRKEKAEEYYKFTVQKKTPSHPFYNQGSSEGYIINNDSSNNKIKLRRWEVYYINVEAEGHPLYLTTSEEGNGEGYPGSLMHLLGPEAKITDKGDYYIEIGPFVPEKFYFQCAKHIKMGYEATVIE